MKCPTCNKPTLFCVNDRCPKCSDVKVDPGKKVESFRKRRRGRPVGSYESRAQSPETKLLQARCIDQMELLGLPAYKYAKHIGLTPSAFYRWIRCEFSVCRQPRFNEKVKEALGSTQT